MTAKPDITAIYNLLEPIVEAQQMELYDVEYLTEYGRQILRLYIDKKEGVTINDCEKINYAVMPILDANDPFPNAYVLEVSSPGIERKLVKDNHYEENKGKQVEVKLNKPLDKRKKFRGTLVGLVDSVNSESDKADKKIEIISDGEEIQLPMDSLVYCRLVYEEQA